jgi:PKD repeat protein
LSDTFRRSIVALAACLALIAVFAAPAVAAPTASFTVAPDPPVSGQPATYTSTSTADPLLAVAKVEWDFDNDGTFEVVNDAAPWTATHTYATAGAKTFVMRVTDNTPLIPQVTTTPQTVTVAQANRPPSALFTFNPASPLVQDPVLFASNSTDPDGDSLDHLWDFGDGSGPVTTRNASHAYALPGTKTVRLTVNDGRGGVDEETHTVVVRDPSAAKASFTFAPSPPLVGQTVTFTSTSTPSSGQSITSQNWDLDSDGQYDDGQGRTVTRAFDTAGVYRVALRVVQANGNPAVAEGTVRVGALVATPPGAGSPPAGPPTNPGSTPNPRAKPSLLSPFPVVRIAGQVYPGRTVVSVLSVRAPRGALVRVRCSGPGCPKVVRRKRSKGAKLRFKTFERSLRPRAKLEVFVVAKGRVGKYTRFKVQRKRRPLRIDLCVVPGKSRPRPCPLDRASGSNLHLTRK